MKEKVAIVTVTYNPNLNEFKENINSYVAQVEKVIVVDNSTDKETIDALDSFCSEFYSIKLIQLKNNLGIAYAQNVGIKYLLDNEFEFLIEMDQDSKLEENYVTKIVTHFKEIKSSIDPKIIALGCLAINSNDGSIYEGYKENEGYKKVLHTLSSGLLLDLATFEVVGFKDEALFIDLVDWDWCWRASRVGFNTYIDTSLKIIHSMGDKHLKILKFDIGVPKPYRHYYAFRNSLYLLTKEHPPLKWKLRVMPLLISKVLLYPLIMDSGFLRIKNMMKGTYDFLFNKMGSKK